MHSLTAGPPPDRTAQGLAALSSAACAGARILQFPGPPRFVTTDAGECHEYVRQATGTHRWSLGRSSRLLHFSHYERQLGRISLNIANSLCTSGFEVVKDGGAKHYRFQFLLDGRCEVSSPLGRYTAEPGDVFILGPDHVTREFWADRCVQYIVQVERLYVEQTIANELRHELRTPLVFRPVARDPGIRPWLQQLGGGGASPPGADAGRDVLADRRVVRSIERALVMMLLTGFEHSETRELMRPVPSIAPWYVRRAEEYIRAHAREDLTTESIATAARVSARSIFYGFKRWRDTTPMAYVREVRLGLAREALLRAGREGGTVSQAAMAAGFSNFSQFSKLYKARYAETPSATLRQG